MKDLRSYLLLVLALSVPLWVAAEFLDATKIIPVKLPFSALQFLSVSIAAVVVTRCRGHSVRELMLRGFDVARIKTPRWRLGVVVLMPLVVWASYGLSMVLDGPVSAQRTPFQGLPVFLLVYGLSGYCEELGWTAIMTDALLARATVMKAGLITGIAWALWHVIPFTQTHNAGVWILWQCAFTITFRVLMTKIYVVTNRSVFATIALHATYNTAFSLMPYYGSSYNPKYVMTITLLATVVVFLIEGQASRRTQGR